MTTPPQPETDVPGEPLRVVLFGLPASGKSSLLGALQRVSSAFPATLAGEIVDASQRFQVLSEREPPTVTPVEVVPYLVEYLPTGGQARPVLLIDCDGVAVLDLLQQPRTSGGPEDRALAREILKADVLLLVIDASSSVKQLETDFAQFSQFLSLVESIRGARVEVGGLPVFLVLNKVDKLAQSGLSPEQWQKKVEGHQRYLIERFESFLRRTETERESSFGLLDLRPAATATSPLPFPNSTEEPFGVGSLFRQAFEEAEQYRARRKSARRRFFWTIGLTCGLIGILVGLLLALLFYPPINFTPTPLNLSQPYEVLEQRLVDLREKRDAANFPRLPTPERDEIQGHIRELEEYLAFYRTVAGVGNPNSIDREKDLESVKSRLADHLIPRLGWRNSPAARLRTERLRDIDALLDAARVARLWYQRTGERVASLRAFGGEKHRSGIVWEQFLDDYDRLMPTTVPPFDVDKPLTTGTTEPTWATVLKIDTVRRVREAFEKNRAELIQVRHVAAALKFTPERPSMPAVLELPSGATLAQVSERVATLKKAYPEYSREFRAAELPEAMSAQTKHVANLRYRDLLGVARAEVRQQLQKHGGDTEKGWIGVRKWLDAPKELADWRVLLAAVNGLRLLAPADPLTQLTDFLDRKSLPINLANVEVSLPLSLELLSPDADKPTRDTVALDVVQQRDGKPVETVKLRLRDIFKDARVGLLRCTFLPGETSLLKFQPGDVMTATLTLPRSTLVVWDSGNRSARYSFERLSLPPRLNGKVEDGIMLKAREPAEGIPAVPDLVP